MTPKQRDMWELVKERDNGMCCECPAPADEVHHIVSRRYEGGWDPRNMISLCVDCHKRKNKGAGAHTHAKRLEHIKYLRDRFGYDYSDMGDRWQELIREIDDTEVGL